MQLGRDAQSKSIEFTSAQIAFVEAYRQVHGLSSFAAAVRAILERYAAL